MEDLPTGEGFDLIRTQCFQCNGVAVGCNEFDFIGFANSVDEYHCSHVARLKCASR